VQTLHTILNFRSLFKAKHSNPPLINCIQNSSSSPLARCREASPMSHSQRARTDQYGTGRAETSGDNRARQRPSNGPAGHLVASERVHQNTNAPAPLGPKDVILKDDVERKTDSVSRTAIKGIAAQHRVPKHCATPPRVVIRQAFFLRASALESVHVTLLPTS
jgi:hypothetical protein